MSTNNAVIGITGATGFIGRTLIRYAAQRPGLVLRLFDKNPGVEAGLAVQALDEDPARFEGLDTLVHLAGLTPRGGTPAEFHAINVALAERVAAAAVRAHVKRFVLVSTLHVHGHCASGPIAPDHPFKPESPYAQSKAEAEARVGMILADAGVACTIVRLPVVYGPGMVGKFSALAKAIRLRIPLPFSAMCVRSMISVTNAADALLHCATAPAASGQILIPADAQDVSMRELAAMIGRLIGRRAHFLPLSRGVASVLFAPFGTRGADFVDSLFESLRVDHTHWASLGWTPVEDSETGLRKALLPAGDRT